VVEGVPGSSTGRADSTTTSNPDSGGTGVQGFPPRFLVVGFSTPRSCSSSPRRPRRPFNCLPRATLMPAARPRHGGDLEGTSAIMAAGLLAQRDLLTSPMPFPGDRHARRPTSAVWRPGGDNGHQEGLRGTCVRFTRACASWTAGTPVPDGIGSAIPRHHDHAHRRPGDLDDTSMPSPCDRDALARHRHGGDLEGTRGIRRGSMGYGGLPRRSWRRAAWECPASPTSAPRVGGAELYLARCEMNCSDEPAL
jgi:hypothetical protein